jgi:hypothetical protein
MPASTPPVAPPEARERPALAVLPLVCALGVCALIFVPRVRADPHLFWTFASVGAVLLAGLAVVAWRAKRTGQRLRAAFVVVRAHYVQAIVQFCIYIYWGSHSAGVYAQLPLIFGQLLFLYALTALLAWSRGRTWQFGFGPMPVILSTNLLLWFRDDYFYLQFAMVATGALGKEFITWKREGRTTHIFNPSVFGQSVFALALIFAGTTREFTMGEEIAVSFESLPHIYLVLFFLGLVVQYLFSVTLMTLAATAALCLLNLSYTGITGTYYFMTLNIGATVFLGLHLLMTDPSTSPRSYVGRIVFGAGYGVGYFLLFRLFDHLDVPLFWDKLLPVGVLNLLVPVIDRWARSGVFGKLNRAWESALEPRKLNLIHMGAWAALFATMIGTGFVEGRHEGRTIAFWKKAYDEGRYRAGENLLTLTKHRAMQGSGEANNMLGMLYLEGKLLEKNDEAAAHFFAEACRQGYPIGCENVVGQFLFQLRARSPEDVTQALDRLEQLCGAVGSGPACFLVGSAYELGRERPLDVARAKELYQLGCDQGSAEACAALKRLAGMRTGTLAPDARRPH